jgi:hypothetical protein
VPSRLIPLAALAAVLAAAGRAPAQPDLVPKDGRVTIPVALTPSDYPKPASRAYLLPEYRESIPGNRVQMFLRCFMEQDTFFGKVETEKREKWNALPLKDLPLSELTNYGGRLLERDLYDAARMTGVDWQLWYFVRRDGINTLLPDVQKMRALASALKARVRGEIAAGDFDGALHTLKTMFGLARTMENHPTLIGQLVGVAIATIAVNAAEEFIQQPGSPNLFWALTDLPVPFLSLRAGMDGERMFISADFDALKTAADPVVDAVLLKKIDAYDEMLRPGTEAPSPRYVAGALKAGLQARAKDAAEVQAARGRLIRAGLKPEHVNVWSPLHVVLLDDEVLCEQYRDELGKWVNLPFWQAKPGMGTAEAAIAAARGKTPFLELVPAFIKVKQAQARLDQRFAYLQVLEALRLYAHAHGGALPAALADTQLPLPLDPVTGRPFEYAVKDGVATLHGENPSAGQGVTNRYYGIRIRK